MVKILFLIISPFIHPCALYHFEVPFCAFFSFTFKVWYLQYPFKKIGETNAINFSFIKVIAETFI